MVGTVETNATLDLVTQQVDLAVTTSAAPSAMTTTSTMTEVTMTEVLTAAATIRTGGRKAPGMVGPEDTEVNVIF